MSRRRRRDGKENEDGLDSEDDSSSEKLDPESDVDNDDLDVSEYESVDEEAQHSIDEEYEEQEADNGDPGGHQPDVEPQKKEEEKSNADLKGHEDVVHLGEGENNAEEDEVSSTKRESGDGKEQSDNEQHKQEDGVDEDEKMKKEEEEDPAFIPTKGAFFQHDLRSDASKGRGRDRKIWDKGPVKWSHDMFVMEEQMPKTRDILISSYGYDIREKQKPPSGDGRRPRGRGRGGYRGGGRGRGRSQNSQREQQYNDFNNRNEEYVEDFPDLSENSRKSVKVKSRSFYKKGESQPNLQDNSTRTQNNSRTQAEINTETPEDKENARQRDENAPATNSKKEEKFSDILQVINSRENTSIVAVSSSPPTSRRYDKHPGSHQNSSFSNYQEAPKPRRYSSLRQRQTNSPVDKQNSSQYSRRQHNTKYSNFARPIEPGRNTIFTNQNHGNSTNTNMSAPNQQYILEEPRQQIPVKPTIQPQQHVVSQPPSMTSVSQTQSNQSQPVGYSAPPPANVGAPLDPSLMQMPNMGLPYPPMLSPMYLEAATAYQRMIRMMSQMTMEQLQHLPPGVSPQMDASSSTIPPDAQSLPHPSDVQINPLQHPPPVSQGSLGSIMRPPPPPMNLPTYFNGLMGMPNLSLGGMPQQPFYPSNLVAQQVGGVTYFNTPTQSPPAIPNTIPIPNQQGSPRRNAAIPIMAPMGFGGFPMLE